MKRIEEFSDLGGCYNYVTFGTAARYVLMIHGYDYSNCRLNNLDQTKDYYRVKVYCDDYAHLVTQLLKCRAEARKCLSLNPRRGHQFHWQHCAYFKSFSVRWCLLAECKICIFDTEFDVICWQEDWKP